MDEERWRRVVDKEWNRGLFERIGSKVMDGYVQGLFYVATHDVELMVRESMLTAMPAIRASDFGTDLEAAIYEMVATAMMGAGVVVGTPPGSADLDRLRVSGFVVLGADELAVGYEQAIITARGWQTDPHEVGRFVREGLMYLAKFYGYRWVEIGARAASVRSIVHTDLKFSEAYNVSTNEQSEGWQTAQTSSTRGDLEDAVRTVARYVAQSRGMPLQSGTVRRRVPGAVTMGSRASDTFTTAEIAARATFVCGDVTWRTDAQEVRGGVYSGVGQILESVVRISDGMEVPGDAHDLAAWVFSASDTRNDWDRMVMKFRNELSPYILTGPQHCYALTHGPADIHISDNVMTTHLVTPRGKVTYHDTVRRAYEGYGDTLPLGRMAELGYQLAKVVGRRVSVMSPLLLGWVAVYNIPLFQSHVQWMAQNVVTTTAPFTRVFGRALAATRGAPDRELRYAVRTTQCVAMGMTAALAEATYDATGPGGFRVSVSGHVIAQTVLIEMLGLPLSLFINTKIMNLRGMQKPIAGFTDFKESGNVKAEEHWHSVVDDLVAVLVAARLVGVKQDHYKTYIDFLFDLSTKYPRYREESALVKDGRDSFRAAPLDWVRALTQRR